MVVLNMQKKISPICISKKLKLYISNLPNGKDNNWNEELCSELWANLRHSEIHAQKLGIKQKNELHKIYKKYFSQESLPDGATENICIQSIVDRMICLYFDYDYADMPMGDWTTNCFDGRLCEEDYTEKIVDFINFLAYGENKLLPSPTPQWIYSSNHDEINLYRMFWGGEEATPYIESMKKWGELIDNFLCNKNDYLLLDYLMNSIHKDNEYNEYHFLKTFSLCQLFLEKERESELDSKLPRFIDARYSQKEKEDCAKLLRRMRNKIAHGDFLAFEGIIEEFATTLMDGRFWFDYSEYSRKNWTIQHVCCLMDDIVRKLIQMLLLDKKQLDSIRKL